MHRILKRSFTRQNRFREWHHNKCWQVFQQGRCIYNTTQHLFHLTRPKGIPCTQQLNEYVWLSDCVDVEFVTKVTNDNCVKYFWARVRLSRTNAKNYPFCDIWWIQAKLFTKQLYRVCIWVDNCKKTENLLQIDEQNVPHSQ